MLIRDIELEILPSTQARLYIGKDALRRNIYQDVKPRKLKSDHSDDYLPLFVLFNT